MTSIRSLFGRKAAKATVRHSVRGVASKAQRRPIRSATLVIIGVAVGAAAGFFAGRKAASSAG